MISAEPRPAAPAAPIAVVLARTILTFPFWCSGLHKLLFFKSGVAEMTHFGLEPAVLVNLATIAIQLTGSAMIIADRGRAAGALLLGFFTLLTIPLVHHFWSITEEPFRTIAFHTATEHLGLIGGLLVAAVTGGSTRAGR
ncbi:DoxX family protein [Sphingomonas sp. DT-51]|uniref:DoxX family protein n=1 Tax=Sphingomonas sp. DT-51 TaxID=3396165 RepID=UPI003F1C66A9